MKKNTILITVAIVVLLDIAFIPDSRGTTLKKNDQQEIPSYAGFSDINQAKNFFLLVGDTQRTSRWEFWREKNSLFPNFRES